MRLNMYGFELEFRRGIDLDMLMEHLEKKHGDEVTFDKLQRLITVDDFDDYWGGIFVTIKDHRNFLKLKRDQGQNRIKVGTIEDGHRLMDFNLFLISKATNRGLYVVYRGSCSMGDFCWFLQKQYKELREELMLQDQKDEDLRREQVAGRYAISLKWLPLTKVENFEQLVAALETVRAFEFEVATATVDEQRFRSVRNIARTEKRRFTFSPDLEPLFVARKLASLIRDEGINKAAAYGEIGNVSKVVHLINNPDLFWDADFDDLTNELDFPIEEYWQASLFENLKEVAEDHPELFVTP